jgi:hypothetical protein
VQQVPWAAAALAAIALVASTAVPASAQVPPGAWPRCIPERDGQELALGGSACECRHEQGGTMIARRPGWRWSCDIMKMDGSQLGIPADDGAGRRGLPPGFVYAPQGGGTPSSGQAPSGSPPDAGPRGPAPLLGGRRPWR